MKRPIFIGITGGTGSGKSTIAKEIYRQFGEDCIAMIEQDSYYIYQWRTELKLTMTIQMLLITIF